MQQLNITKTGAQMKQDIIGDTLMAKALSRLLKALQLLANDANAILCGFYA